MRKSIAVIFQAVDRRTFFPPTVISAPSVYPSIHPILVYGIFLFVIADATDAGKGVARVSGPIVADLAVNSLKAEPGMSHRHATDCAMLKGASWARIKTLLIRSGVQRQRNSILKKTKPSFLQINTNQ